ncbi:MAG: N(4)-(beta-N-acetylglucosaminyl)-L-asparaginase [Armatimonadetes bacterium]|nr:N(4)-(beta-N-acetylglucosaminyl)-L-asparaginase [Armatimonadota bacterium]
MTKILATWEKPGKKALQGAADSHRQGNPLLRCLEDGLALAEDDPEFVSIGRGGLPNSDGEIELDASVMDGRDLSCGAVCALRGILPAITVARLVMEKTEHVMLAGDQARAFAIQCGLKPQDLMTETAADHYRTYLKSPKRAKAYVHTLSDTPPDTITMLAMEDGPHCAAACSTSGLAYKLPGRVGDSPIIGAGIYADDQAGVAGATGWGEDLLKSCASLRAVDAMRTGMSAQEACDHAMRLMTERRPDTKDRHSVVLAIDKTGDHGVAVIGKKFDLWIYEDGKVSTEAYEPPNT